MTDIIINNSAIKDVRLFVFDKDGTLMDLYTYWYHMVELRAERICLFYQLDINPHKTHLMSVMGIDLKNKRIKPEGPVGFLSREVVQKSAEKYLANLNLKNVSDVCYRAFKEADVLSLSFFDKIVKPIKGVEDLFRHIKSKGGKIAIATSDKTERAKLALKILMLEDFVDLVVGAEKVKFPKPSPEILMFICNSLGIGPEYSVAIGDSELDIQMGINSNFKASIGVRSGLVGNGTLSKLTPYVIEDVSKIGIE